MSSKSADVRIHWPHLRRKHRLGEKEKLMDNYAQNAIDALEELLKDASPGIRLEAARELLKYDVAMNR